MTHFADQFAKQMNCVMLSEWACGECNFHFLTDRRGGEMKCPSCGKLLEASGSIVVSQVECQHTLGQHGHENRPKG